MSNLKFVFSLRKSYEAYLKEMNDARENYPEYHRYLRNLSFKELVDQVVSACAMFPRSIEHCKDNLCDLSYGIINELGIGSDRLDDSSIYSLARLVSYCGQEVLKYLDGAGYYIDSRRFPAGWREDIDFETDLTAVVKTKMMNAYTVTVTTDEYYFDDVEACKTYRLNTSPSRIGHLIPKH